MRKSLLNNIKNIICIFIKFYFISIKLYSFFINHVIYLKLSVYIDGNPLLTYIYLYSIVLIKIIKTIARFFMLAHGNYSIFFMEINKFENFTIIDHLKKIIKIMDI